MLITQSRLIADLKMLGVEAGQTVMVHGSVKSVGEVLGGPNVILQALFDALGSDGTVMMYVGWEDMPETMDNLMPADCAIRLKEWPMFDLRTSRAVREHGILAECLRTWPNACRSNNPEASMVGCGARAAWLVEGHSLNYGYGPESPLAKLVQVGGKVLMLGAPLDTITLLHHAENLAKLRNKNVVHYSCPMKIDDHRVWIDFEDYNTGKPHADYTFEQIAQCYMAMNEIKSWGVGNAKSYLFDAAALTAFAVEWLEANFG